MSPTSSVRSELDQRFQTEFGRLNSAQQEAVTSIDGPVIVLAGPGTGKTQVLALRIANILRQTDAGPKAILALTFTDSGAKEMRERLVQIIGPDAYALSISTFHSFCNEVILSNSEFFPQFAQAQPLSDPDRYALLENILTENAFPRLKPLSQPFHYLADILKAIQDLKQEDVEPEKLRVLIGTERESLQVEAAELAAGKYQEKLKELEKHEELLQIYILYQEQLKKMGAYDYADMVDEVSKTFRDVPELLSKYQEKFLYFLADEYQDTNTAQNDVLLLLAKFWQQDANIFVVGDISQSIYRFQGASLENTLRFLETYPEAKRIVLTENYRSGQPLLNAAAELIQHNQVSLKDVASSVKTKEKTELALHAQSQKAANKLRIIEVPAELLEQAFVVEDIQRLVQFGEKLDDIAVLVRNNADAESWAAVLNKMSIPAVSKADKGVLGLSAVQQLITLLKAIRDLRKGGDTALFDWLSFPWSGVDHAALLQLNRYAATHRPRPLSMGEVLLAGAASLPDYLRSMVGTQIWQKVRQLDEWSRLEAELPFFNWVEALLQESGLLQYVLAGQDVAEQLTGLQSFLSEIHHWTLAYSLPDKLRLQDCLQKIEVLQAHNLDIPRQDLGMELPTVTVSTAHKAKGLEWKFVYLVQCTEQKWGKTTRAQKLKLPEGVLGHQQPTDQDAQDDERRLFYVAMTRAKEQLTLSYSRKVISGGKLRAQLPSIFLSELPTETLEYVDVTELQARSTQILQAYFAQPIPTSLTPEFKHWVQDLLVDYNLSPTHLNTFLECERKFLYGSLLKVPRPQSINLSYGSAVHTGLQVYFRAWLGHSTQPTVEVALQAFEDALRREPLTERELDAWLAKGKHALSAYFEHYGHQFRKPLGVERFLGGFGRPLLVGDQRVSGKLDKIEWIDISKNIVGVVDYKTGLPKSRNEIEGKTAKQNANYKRQLTFYQLLTQIDPTFPAKVAEVTLDFIERKENTGAFKREVFTITQEEVAELKNIIREVSLRMRTGEFPKTTDTTKCENCEFRRICWPENKLPVGDVQLQLMTEALLPTGDSEVNAVGKALVDRKPGQLWVEHHKPARRKQK